MTGSTRTSDDGGAFRDIGELLAHALEMEHEAVLRYQQLADSLELHHNHAVAELFRQLATRSEALAGRVGERARGVALPRIAPWAFKWDCPHSPKAGDCLDERIGYRMTALEALQLALHNETRGHDFYAAVAAVAGDDEVRALATELAADQQQHLNWLQAWFRRIEAGYEPADEDLDPPNVTA